MDTRPIAFLVTALVSACGGTSPAIQALPPDPHAARGGDRTTAAPAAGPAVVRERAARPMPTCVAGDLRALATLTEGVPAMAAVARGNRGALIVYLTDSNHDGALELMAQPIDAAGQLHGAAVTIATGTIAHPALIVRGAGFRAAWREGAAGQERLHLRSLRADGSPEPNDIALPELPPGWLGPPLLLDAGEGILAVAHSPRSGAGASHSRDGEDRRGESMAIVVPGAASVRFVAAPEGGVFDATRAPVGALIGSAPRMFAVVMRRDAALGDERSLVELPAANDGALRLVARDIDAASALAMGDRLFLSWRAQVGPRDVAARVFSLPASGEPNIPPVTVAVLRGAFGAEAGLVPIEAAGGSSSGHGAGTVGVFTLSTLADDSGGTLNVSALDASGEYIGRTPMLVSSLVRNARIVAAPRTDDQAEAWFVLEARGDAGSGPVLGIAPVRCESGQSRPVDPLRIPPASLPQQLATPDEPPVRLATQRADAAGSCTAAGAPVVFARHQSTDPNILTGTSTGLVHLGRAAVLFAVVKEQGASVGHLTVAALDARNALTTPRSLLEGAGQILATGTSGAAAVAIVTSGSDLAHVSIVSAGADGRARAPVSVAITNATSAVVVPGTGTILVAGEAERAAGDVSLLAVPFRNGRAGPPSVVARLRPGDRVLDAVHAGNETAVLLARPDVFGESVARALARWVIPDDARMATRRSETLEPFADPLGYGRGDAMFLRGATTTSVVYVDRDIVRVGDVERGELRNLRSVVGVYPRGGALLDRGHAVGDARWIAVATGYPEDAAQRVSPLTLVQFNARGTTGAITRGFPDDPIAIAERASVVGDAAHVTLVYGRAEPNGALAWVAAQANCTSAGTHSGTAMPAATPTTNTPAAPAGPGGAR